VIGASDVGAVGATCELSLRRMPKEMGLVVPIPHDPVREQDNTARTGGNQSYSVLVPNGRHRLVRDVDRIDFGGRSPH
jgi:hypothetical protein